MKTTFIIAGMVLGLAATNAFGESFRTDINPALIYGRAFLLAPDLEKADSDYLFTNNWQGQRVPERMGKLLAGYDNQMKLVCQAAHSTVPCDWGIDMTPGPATLLPGLARAKAVAQVVRLRVPWHVQNGRDAQAIEELLGCFAFARNVARDGTLISTLVQIAMEAIQCSTIAANFGQFSPEALKQLENGLANLPSRHTVAECVPTEKAFFLEWTRRKILELKEQHPGDDAKVMDAIHKLLASVGSEPEDQDTMWSRLTQAAGGTSDGILKLLDEREQLYDQTVEVLSVPCSRFETEARGLTELLEKSGNPFLTESIPPFLKSRKRELRIEATFAVMRAALAYKLRGESGLRSINDPCGSGPFAFKRFAFEGVDRGFELKSRFDLDTNLVQLIFVEKEGAPFQVDGNYPGRPLPKTVPQQ